MQPPEKAPEEQAPQEEESPSMSSGTTEGLDGDIEYEPFIPTNPTIEQPTVEMSPGGPSEPLPPPPPTQPVPGAERSRHEARRVARRCRRSSDRRARRRWRRHHARQQLVDVELRAGHIDRAFRVVGRVVWLVRFRIAIRADVELGPVPDRT